MAEEKIRASGACILLRPCEDCCTCRNDVRRKDPPPEGCCCDTWAGDVVVAAAAGIVDAAGASSGDVAAEHAAAAAAADVPPEEAPSRRDDPSIPTIQYRIRRLQNSAYVAETAQINSKLTLYKQSLNTHPQNE